MPVDAVAVAHRHEHERARPRPVSPNGDQSVGGLAGGSGRRIRSGALAEHAREHRGRDVAGVVAGGTSTGGPSQRVHREHGLDPVGLGEVQVEGARVPAEQLLRDAHDDPRRLLGGAGGAQAPAHLEEGRARALRAAVLGIPTR